MKKKYVGISLLIVFLLVIGSMNSACSSEVEKYNEKSLDFYSLKTKVIEKLDILSKEQFSFISLINQYSLVKSSDDPDGPLSGGLDDSSDFSSLFWGLAGFVFLTFPLPMLLNPENLLQLIGGVLGVSTSSFNIIMQLGEAFDLIEYVEDGC